MEIEFPSQTFLYLDTPSPPSRSQPWPMLTFNTSLELRDSPHLATMGPIDLIHLPPHHLQASENLSSKQTAKKPSCSISWTNFKHSIIPIHILYLRLLCAALNPRVKALFLRQLRGSLSKERLAHVLDTRQKSRSRGFLERNMSPERLIPHKTEDKIKKTG